MELHFWLIAISLIGFSPSLVYLWRKQSSLVPSQKADHLPGSNPSNFPRLHANLCIPLTKARFLTDKLLSEPHLRQYEEGLQQIRAIRFNLARIEEQLHEIQHTEKLEKLQFSVFQLSSFATELSSSFEPMLFSKDIKLRYVLDLDTDLIYTDALKTTKIVLNLMLNAIFAVSKGGEITLLLQTRESDNSIVHFSCTVTDNGPPIIKKNYTDPNLWHIREGLPAAFNQSSSTLPLSAEMARAMDGNLYAFLGPEGKTSFKLDLACFKPATHPLPSSKEAFPEFTIPEKLPFVLYMVIPDKELSDLLSSMFIRHFSVIALSSAEAFLHLSSVQQKINPAVNNMLLIDLHLPEMDGIQLLQHLRNHPQYSSLPAIALSSINFPKERSHAYFAGFDDVVMKPFDSSELLVRIYRAFQRSQNFKTAFQFQNVAQPLPQNMYLPPNAEGVHNAPEIEKDEGARLIMFIRQNCEDEKMGISLMSKFMGISKRHLFRITKETIGLSPFQLLQKIRLEKALHLIENEPDLSISEVAYKVGINNPAYFSVIFKKRYGKSPSEFKRQ